MHISVISSDPHVVIAVAGRLDTASSPQLLDSLNAQIDAGRLDLVLDITSMDYICSSGLRVLLMALKRVSPSDGHILLCGINDNVREVFDMAGFMSLFPMYANRESALEALK